MCYKCDAVKNGDPYGTLLRAEALMMERVLTIKMTVGETAELAQAVVSNVERNSNDDLRWRDVHASMRVIDEEITKLAVKMQEHIKQGRHPASSATLDTHTGKAH